MSGCPPGLELVEGVVGERDLFESEPLQQRRRVPGMVAAHRQPGRPAAGLLHCHEQVEGGLSSGRMRPVPSSRTAVSRSLRVQRSQSRPPRSLPSKPQREQSNDWTKPAQGAQMVAPSSRRTPGRARRWPHPGQVPRVRTARSEQVRQTCPSGQRAANQPCLLHLRATVCRWPASTRARILTACPLVGCRFGRLVRAACPAVPLVWAEGRLSTLGTPGPRVRSFARSVPPAPVLRHRSVILPRRAGLYAEYRLTGG